MVFEPVWSAKGFTFCLRSLVSQKRMWVIEVSVNFSESNVNSHMHGIWYQGQETRHSDWIKTKQMVLFFYTSFMVDIPK